jgi:thymidylate synthase (FAD)
MKNGLIRELKVDSKLLSKKTVERASKYIVLTGDDFTDYQSIVMLEILRQNILKGTSNDISKYNLLEAYKTSLVWTINARSLQNFLALRSSKAALWEIRDLANTIYEALPEDHKFLFKDCIHESAN